MPFTYQFCTLASAPIIPLNPSCPHKHQPNDIHLAKLNDFLVLSFWTIQLQFSLLISVSFKLYTLDFHKLLILVMQLFPASSDGLPGAKILVSALVSLSPFWNSELCSWSLAASAHILLKQCHQLLRP